MKKGRIQNLIIKDNRLPHIPKCAGVYKITDHTNNKCYIGSCQNMNIRCAKYISTGNVHPRGMDFNNITFEVLENCKYLSKLQRLQLELEHILKHNTVHPIGYNKRNPVTNQAFKKAVKEPKKKAVKRKVKTNYGKPPKTGVNVIKY